MTSSRFTADAGFCSITTGLNVECDVMNLFGGFAELEARVCPGI